MLQPCNAHALCCISRRGAGAASLWALQTGSHSSYLVGALSEGRLDYRAQIEVGVFTEDWNEIADG